MVGYLNYTASTGRFLAVDKSAPGNPAIFDTDGGLLYTPPSNVFSGSISIPARAASSSGVNGSQNILDLTAEYYIGPLNVASANIVRGLIRYDGVSDNNLWRQAYGSHRKEWDAVSFTAVPQTDLVGKYYSAVMQDFTPLVNNLGHVVMRERTVIRARDPGSPPSITKSLPAFTLQYRLHSDFWWGNPEIVPRGDFISAGSVVTSSSSYTATLGFGYEYPDRRILVVIHTRGQTSAPTSVTVAGVAATIHGFVQSGNAGIAIASAPLSTGQVGAVVVNHNAAHTVMRVETYSVRAVGAFSPVITSSTAQSVTSISATPNIAIGKECASFANIAIASSGITTTVAWSGGAAQGDAILFYSPTQVGPKNFSATAETTSGGSPVSVSWPSAGDAALMCMVF